MPPPVIRRSLIMTQRPSLALLHVRLAGIAVLQQAGRNPVLFASLGVGNQTALRGSADDGLERSARHDDIGYARIHDLAIAAVAEDEPVLGVVEAKPSEMLSIASTSRCSLR